MSPRRNIEVGPVRWKFIKSPSPREPYKNIKKLYEVELSNLKVKSVSDLNKNEILKIRERTRKVLKKKYQRELIQNITALSIIMIFAIVLIWYFVS